MFSIVAWSYYNITMRDIEDADTDMKKHYWVRTCFQTFALALLMTSGYLFVVRKMCEVHNTTNNYIVVPAAFSSLQQ
jgi:hypothetical protein